MFFENFKKTADKLPDDLRLKFYDALTDYVFFGVEPEDPILGALVTAIKPSLDREDARGGSRSGSGRPKSNENQTEIKNNQKNQNGNFDYFEKSNEIKNNQKNQNELLKKNENQKNQSFLETETETETENKKRDTDVSPKKADETEKQIEFSESFETFWSVYPKKRAGSKEKAFKAYQSALRRKNATAEEINRVAAIYAKSDEVSRGFAKGAAAWLNDDRFLNDYGGSGGAAAPKSEIDDNAPVYYDAESGSGRVLGKWYYNYTDFSKARAEYWEREKNGELAN